MKVSLIHYPSEDDWLFMKQCTLVTVNKHTDKAPSLEFRRKLLLARHSPIRVLQFAFLFEDLPYYISVHFSRHVHGQPFISTQRNDRQDNYDRNAARQDAPVRMIWYMNAEELLTIANKRLCTKATKETREVVKKMCDLVEDQCPEFAGLFEPMCKRNGGICYEIESCGLADKFRAKACDLFEDGTLSIEVASANYRDTERLLLLEENTDHARMFYCEEGGDIL